ncbi:hypothetical protein [Flavitalea sp. BT771]|uniref:hypothetical protein n=1 Tax=Flavitalea sp. BT771 TaxID=3063329 RepID=UPI00294B4F7D|nr:hypothetical protein [Flavitalea sp. BT771]
MSELHFDLEDLNYLASLRPRDGFEMVAEDEFRQMIDLFSQSRDLAQIIPILTDSHSNYICVYKNGPLKGFICNYDHEETDLTPRFSNITSLVKAINSYTGSWEIRNFPDEAFDYPSAKRLISTEREQVIIAKLAEEFAIEQDEQISIQLAFSIMALTPLQDISLLYPFLDHENMYIQERAIRIMGFYRHEPIKEKLVSLAATAKHNGRIAVQTVLRNWTNSSNSTFIW